MVHAKRSRPQLCVARARLIFNADGSEDKEIASLLTEALALREEMELYAQV